MNRSPKETFTEYFRNNIKREGSAELLAWLGESDFFTAPASTKFHLAEPEGLCIHSIHVYERLRAIYSEEKKLPLTPEEEEKLAVVGLLHDVCKTDFSVFQYILIYCMFIGVCSPAKLFNIPFSPAAQRNPPPPQRRAKPLRACKSRG